MTGTEARMECLRLAVRVAEVNASTTRANTHMGMGVVLQNPIAHSAVTDTAKAFLAFVNDTKDTPCPAS